MPAGDSGPDLPGFLGGEKAKRYGVPRRSGGAEDLAVERAGTRSALGDDGEGLEPCFEDPHRAVVPGVCSHVSETKRC